MRTWDKLDHPDKMALVIVATIGCIVAMPITLFLFGKGFIFWEITVLALDGLGLVLIYTAAWILATQTGITKDKKKDILLARTLVTILVVHAGSCTGAMATCLVLHLPLEGTTRSILAIAAFLTGFVYTCQKVDTSQLP